ncbi:MAG: phosphatase PAP2 family protein [Saprospiraceae bacterium]|nr:phosphatase PAP2 family protein [Saprospiraceae bacterium]
MKTGHLLLLGIVIACHGLLSAQERSDSLQSDGTYHVNYWVSLPALAAGLYVTTEGHERVNDRAPLSEALLASLDPSVVPGFDRISLRQDTSRYRRALDISDIGITYFPLAPVLLFLDRDMRQDWFDIAIVYAETQMAVLNVYNYTFLGPTFIRRYRPIVYYHDLPLEERMFARNRNSFYSGHTSTVSATTYFMVQTYLNYHPEYTGKKWLLYGLAAVPPVFVGIKRIQGLKHYPSDVVVGALVGAAGGIFWPKLHQKSRKRNKEMSVSMVYGSDLKMMRLSYRF